MHIRLLCGVALFFGIVAASNAVADPPVAATQPDDPLIAKLIAKCEENRAAVVSAHGETTFTYERSWLNPGPGEERLNSGFERRKVEWWMDEERRRTDEDSLPLDAGAVRFCPEKHLKTTWDQDTRIYVATSKTGLHAAVNAPYSRSFRYVRGLTAFFDPMLFYKANDFNLEEWFSFFKLQKMSVSVQNKGDSNEIAAEYAVNKRHFRICMTVDERVGCNITAVQWRDITTDPSAIPLLDFRESFARVPRTRPFFPVDYYLKEYFDHEHKDYEKVEVHFEHVTCNVHIDPHVFTFDGMEVPFGVPLSDMRGKVHRELRYDGKSWDLIKGEASF